MLKNLKITKFIITAFLFGLLFGCGSTQQSGNGKQLVSLQDASEPASFYLDQIRSWQSKAIQNRYSLLAVHAYLKADDYQNADNLLAELASQLVADDQIKAEYQYLSALSKASQNQPEYALSLLNYSKKWQLPDWQWQAYYRLKAKIYQQLNQPIDEIKQLSKLSQVVTGDEQKAVNNEIWLALRPLPQELIAQYTNDRHTPIFSGWMQLAFIAKYYAVTPNDLIRFLGQWQQQNPSHPGSVSLPTDLAKALTTKPFKPQRIAVLLPMTGKMANIANPVEQGLLSEYLAQKQGAALAFYDTATDVISAYQKAVAEGAEFIIGPLLPANVVKLKQFQSENGQHIPQLFLNNADNLPIGTNQFYFSLSPTQEAAEAADRLFADNKKMPLVIANSDATGQRMSESFSERWLQLTGTEPEVHFYQDGDRMRVAVQRSLGVIDSVERINRIKTIVGQRVKADFRSRRDIDAIYMITGSQDLTLLKPFIDVNFSVFVKPVPLYTSSRGRTNRERGQNAAELNNIIISDIPWLIEPVEEKSQVKKLWPSWNNSQKRLYAMGADSLDLVGKLAQMHAFPGYQFKGRSGLLSVNEQGVIRRQLSWGQYQRGQLVPLADKDIHESRARS